MLETTAFGNLCFALSGGRFFRTEFEKNLSIQDYVLSTDKEEISYVCWSCSNDMDNPKNWSFCYKCFVTFLVCAMTVFVYLGSSIVVPGIPELCERFGVSYSVGALSISLFVWGYGLGPMFLSPITEVARIGRNWPYIISIGLFVIMQIPSAFCDNIAGFLILRFISGFLGSPVLATGGATMVDIWNLDGGLMNGIAFWSFAACGGPGLGPLLSGFAVEKKGWKWIVYPLLCGTGLVWLLVFFTLPETSSDTILSRRASALRSITKKKYFMSKGEEKDSHISLSKLVYGTLYRPLKMTFTEPVLFFSNLYIAYVYGITYCLYVLSLSFCFVLTNKSFEAFPMVCNHYICLPPDLPGRAWILPRPI